MKKIIYELGKTFYAIAITAGVCTLIYQLQLNIQINGYNFGNYALYEHWTIKVFDVGCVAFFLGGLFLFTYALSSLIETIKQEKRAKLVNDISSKIIEKLDNKTKSKKKLAKRNCNCDYDYVEVDDEDVELYEE